MNNQEKIDFILDQIYQIDIHSKIISDNISMGYNNKDGQPSYESILEGYQIRKIILQQELSLLTN